MFTKRFFLSFSIIFYFHFVFSQKQQQEFDYLKVDNGLPHSSVNDIIQDNLGYIWFATDDGICFFDNYKFKTFRKNKSDTNGLTSNQAYKFHIDTHGKLWVGTKQSLELYDEQTESLKHFNLRNSATNEMITIIEIVQENDSLLLLGTDGSGLLSFNTSTFKKSQFLPKECANKIGNRIASIQKDKYGRFWIGSLNKGLFLYNPDAGDSKSFTLKQFLKNVEIRKVIKLNDTELLLATYGHGTLKININNFTIEPFLKVPNDTNFALRVFDLFLSDNVVFIGTDGDGLLQYDLESKNITSHKNHGTHTKSISNNVIKSIYTDTEKNLWLGHYLGGISLSRNKNQFKNLKYSPFSKLSLSHSNVTAVAIDARKNIWIGTDGEGINIIRNGKIINSLNNNLHTFFKTKHYPKNILTIFEDNNENIWLGTYLDGIYIYNPKNKTLKHFNELYPNLKISNSDIRFITQDNNGKYWIGTNGGGVNIVDIENQKIQVLKRNINSDYNSLSLDWIRCIYEDKFGFIWIGTAYGVNVYDQVNQTTRKYLYDNNDSTSISSNFIYTITEDVNNEIWIGTTSGLNKYNRKTDEFTSYNEKHGLPSNIINSIIDTKDGDLWISTSNGLSKFDINKKKFTNYNITDGLVSNSFLNGAYYNDSNNVLYFGSIAGLTYFKPNEIYDIDYDIPIVLTEFRLFNKPIYTGQIVNKRQILSSNIAYTKSITLLQKENVITLEFAGLSFSYSDKLNYQYRLLGFSDTWNKLSTDNAVTYTNLKSGTYNFQVRVSNMGVAQPTRNLEIIVLPPFYQTVWFKLTLTFLILLISIVIIRQRLKNITNQRDLLKQKFELEKLNADKERINLQNRIQETEIRFRQDEMNYKNSQLVSTTMLLTHKNEKMNHIKNKIGTFIKEVQDKELKSNLKDLIEAINSEFKVEEDWKRFEAHFNDVHKDFIKRLKANYPDMSITYLKLCAYLKLDLSSKEIASLMNISQRGVEKSRSRLRKKLMIDPKESLSSFISKI